jgi:hypothetical protein
MTTNKSLTMKLIFFLVAFGLVFYRFYHLSTNHGKHGNDGNILMTGDNLYEKVEWSGVIEFNDAETGVESISPRGCLKYVKNEKKLLIESDNHGKLSYEISDRGKTIPLDEAGKKIVEEAIKEMIGLGFNLNARVEKIFNRGGVPALLTESAKMKMDMTKSVYLNRVFKCDSISNQDLIAVLQQIKEMGNDMDKQVQLKHFTAKDWGDSSISHAWLNIVQDLGSDMAKMDVLEYFIMKRGYSDSSISMVITIANDFGSDMEKEHLISLLISKKALPENLTGRVLETVGNFGSDMEKENMYSKLLNENIQTEAQWISLTNQAANFGSDFEKSNMLVKIAQKMPKSDTLKMIYLKVARTINSDADYGKAIKAME